MKVFFHEYATQASDIPRPTPIVLTFPPKEPQRYHRSCRESRTAQDGTRSRTRYRTRLDRPRPVRDDRRGTPEGTGEASGGGNDAGASRGTSLYRPGAGRWQQRLAGPQAGE